MVVVVVVGRSLHVGLVTAGRAGRKRGRTVGGCAGGAGGAVRRRAGVAAGGRLLRQRRHGNLVRVRELVRPVVEQMRGRRGRRGVLEGRRMMRRHGQVAAPRQHRVRDARQRCRRRVH